MIQQTSLLSFEEIRQDSDGLNERYAMIITTLKNNPEGLTDRELTKLLGFSDPNSVRPRRNELLKMSLITEKEKRKCSVSGKTSIVWTTAK